MEVGERRQVSGLVGGTSMNSCNYKHTHHTHHALVVYSGWGMEDMCTSYTPRGKGQMSRLHSVH